GVRNVAFVFGAISAQGPKKSRGKRAATVEEHESDESNDETLTSSQVASTASQNWIADYPTIVNEKLGPCINYWIALTTPNGAPANPLVIHRALLECDVETVAQQVPCYEGKESSAMKELFRVLKDHKNQMIQELVNASYGHCFRNEMDSLMGEEDFMDTQDWGTEKVARDFLELLNFNKKSHKDKVPCLIGDGDANSGKTSLFHPILGIVHHTNIATITRQRVFNKAMILKSTKVIFIDEASTSTMDIDDWNILTQGGYTACDVKYQTAKSFINRCPMLLTAQTKLHFKPEDQPAMDRRLRNYSFKSLPAPKKSASAWLRRHPIECIVWAAAQARACMTSASEDELSDEESADDGVLAATDNEQIRALCMDEVLDDRDASPVGVSVQRATDETEDDSDASSQDDQTISALRRVMERCSQTSLRPRKVSAILQARLSERERQRQAGEAVYRRRQENLLSKGVAREHVALLPRDTLEPMATQIENDLTAFRQQTLQEDLQRKRETALGTFQTPWQLAMEQELHKLTRALEMSDMNQERRTSMEAYREVLQDKLRQFHQNYGTAGCYFALEQRKQSCVTMGLLKKEQRFLVTSLFQVLPTEDESGES
ncbi:unnamed protein product, partial [Porites evermanni]